MSPIRAAALLILAALPVLFMPGCVPEPETQYARGDIPDERREIFVLNSLAETITVIHPDAAASGASEETCIFNDVTLTGSAPNHIASLSGRLWVVNSLDNTLTCYLEDTLEEEAEIRLDRGVNPWQLILDGDGSSGYIPCYVSGTVLRIDLSSYPDSSAAAPPAEEAASGLSLPEGGGICLNSAGVELLFVANSNNNATTIGPGFLTVIDTAAGTAASVNLEAEGFNEETDRGCNPQAVIVFEELGEIHAVCTGDHPGSGYNSDDGEIVVIDVDSLAVTARIAIGGSPNAFPAGIDPSGKRVFLANNGYGITAYNYETHEVIRGSDNPIFPEGGLEGSCLSALLYDPVTDLLFISDFSQDTIHILRGNGEGEYETLRTLSGSDGPGFLLLGEE